MLLHAAVIWGAAAIIRAAVRAVADAADAGLAGRRRRRLARGRGRSPRSSRAPRGRRFPIGPLCGRAVVRRRALRRSLARVNRADPPRSRRAPAWRSSSWRCWRRRSRCAPSLLAHATEAKSGWSRTAFGPQAVSLREDLQRRLQASGRSDRRDSRRWRNCSGRAARRRATNLAFAVWSRTELATYRLTSAVELYGPDGRLLSRFALSLPEYSNDAVSRRRMQLGAALRRGVAVRIERAARAADEPRRLRARPAWSAASSCA